MDANGDNQVNLTNSPDADDREPDWSPDEERIAYQSKDTGHYDIFVMSAAGKNNRNVTNKPDSRDQHPAWSPDGGSIAFTSNRDGNDDIFVMQANGNRPRNSDREGYRRTGRTKAGECARLPSVVDCRWQEDCLQQCE